MLRHTDFSWVPVNGHTPPFRLYTISFPETGTGFRFATYGLLVVTGYFLEFIGVIWGIRT